MNTFTKPPIAALALFALSTSAQAHHHHQHHSACLSVTQDALSDFRQILVSARTHARTDHNDHASVNVYARKHRHSVVKSIQVVDTIISDLNNNSDPDVTAFAEAGRVVRKTDDIRKLLINGQWWATLSGVYNDRAEGTRSSAYQSLQLLTEAIDVADQLDHKVKTCFMAPYLLL